MYSVEAFFLSLTPAVFKCLLLIVSCAGFFLYRQGHKIRNIYFFYVYIYISKQRIILHLFVIFYSLAYMLFHYSITHTLLGIMNMLLFVSYIIYILALCYSTHFNHWYAFWYGFLCILHVFFLPFSAIGLLLFLTVSGLLTQLIFVSFGWWITTKLLVNT